MADVRPPQALFLPGINPAADDWSQMAGTDAPRRALLDGALPLAALLSVALLIGGMDGVVAYAITTLYLVFAAGISSGGSERPGEPDSAWRLYALSMGLLAVTVPFGGLFVVPGLAVFAIGFLVHLKVKAGHGICRVGILSACGRRAHDARVGRTLEAAALVLAAAVVLAAPVLYAVAGWLLTAAAVAERPDQAAEPVAELVLPQTI